jgi:hypothetical protein
MAPGLNPDSEIRVDFSGDEIDTFVSLLSKTQLIQPSAAQMTTYGTTIPGFLATYTFTGLDRDARYYGWILIKSTINLKVFSSDAMASTAGSIKTDPYTFINSGLLTFTRNSIATRVNSLGLIEEVPINTARLNNDPITLAPKGLLIEEERSNVLLRSSNMVSGLWSRVGTSIATSTDIPIFASDGVFIITGDGVNRPKNIQRHFPASATMKTFYVFLRRGTNDFAQLMGGGDINVFVNFDLATGIVGTRGSAVTASTIQPWRDNWYRYMLTTSSTTVDAFFYLYRRV